MRVGIVGAGISGIAAARTLRASGAEVVLFEKSRGVGGRCATRRVGGYTFDHGATSIAPRGKSLERVMLEELPTEDLVRVTQSIYTHSALRVAPGSSGRGSAPRYVYRQGISQLAKLLAKDLDVRLQHQIDSLTPEGKEWIIGEERFQALILTAPVPQTTLLLWQLNEKRPTANVSYRSCISILLGYSKPLETPYHALIDVEQRHPLGWMSIESVKSPDRAPEGHSAFVMQLSASFSLEHYMDEDPILVDTAVSFVSRLYGEDWNEPEVKQVQRWKYSQPEGFADIATVNRLGDSLVIAGDGFMGPRIEDAYESGLAAARLILECNS